MEITIIGAGPIGSYAAYLLAKSGHDVSVYERKSEMGLPIQCTGILTSDFNQFNIPLDSFLVNTIQKIEAYSPYKEKVEIKQKDYIVCRKKFDNYFANLARTAGAKILLNHVFLGKEHSILVIKDIINNQELKIKADLVIAADGPLSPTAKAYEFYHQDRENYYGIQAIVKGNFKPEVTKTYFGNKVCPGFFVWVVPESSIQARVGLYCKKNAKLYFDRFMKENDFKVLEMQAGVIPVFNPKQKLQKDNCYVVGDASGYVKATTGGGIVSGMKQVEILVNSINKKTNLKKGMKSLKRKMQLHLSLAKMMEKFSDRDWDKLFNYVSQEKVSQILGTYTRDNPLPLISKTLWKEPRLLRFIKHIF